MERFDTTYDQGGAETIGLSDHSTHAVEPSIMSKVMTAIADCTSFASILRIFGVLIMIAASSAFLLQGWESYHDIQRYYLMLAQTMLLAMGGFGLSYLLKENKGARAFFGLGILSVSANMATLGALLFSLMAAAKGYVYPEFMHWSAIGGGSFIMAVSIGLLVMVLMLRFSYMIFARNSAHFLAVLGMFTNLLILAPVRDSFGLGLVVLLAVAVPALALPKQMQRDPVLRTAGGFFAMATLFVPAIIMVVRSLWLYEADDVLQIMLAGALFVVLHLFSRLSAQDSWAKTPLDFFSMVAALHVAAPAAELLDHYVIRELELIIPALMFAGLGYVVSQRDGGKKPIVLALSATTIAAAALVTMVIVESFLSGVLCMLAGGLIFTLAKGLQMRKAAIMGVGVTLAGVTYQLFEIIHFVNFANWITLAILGVCAIVGASVIERHGATIKLKWQALTQRAHF